jgi:transposase-like protein
MSNKPRRARTPITPQFKERIVRDHHDLHLTILQLSRKYKCCFQTVKNICSKNEYGFWNKPAGLAKVVKNKPKPLVSDLRKHLSRAEREQLILNDMITIIELANQRMRERLEENDQSLTCSQIAEFHKCVSGYVTAKKSDTSKVATDEPKSDSEMFRMFKRQIGEHGKEN